MLSFSVKRLILPALAALLLLGSGCDNEQPATAETVDRLPEKIAGEWVLVEATRNGKKTETLNNAELQFNADGTAMVNLTGTPQYAKWQSQGNVITLSETQDPYLNTQFTVTDLTDDRLVYDMTINSFSFTMHFQPKPEEVLEE